MVTLRQKRPSRFHDQGLRALNARWENGIRIKYESLDEI